MAHAADLGPVRVLAVSRLLRSFRLGYSTIAFLAPEGQLSLLGDRELFAPHISGRRRRLTSLCRQTAERLAPDGRDKSAVAGMSL